MSRIEIENATRISQAWGVFLISKDGSKVQPSEAYALDKVGNLVSGDGDDISTHIANGGNFVTYDGYATEAAAKAIADQVNASHADGVARYGWEDDGSLCEARPLPPGTVFYENEIAHLVREPRHVSVKRIDEFTKAYLINGLAAEIRTSDSNVTVYRDGAPVATLQRAGYFERIEGKPAWRMVALDGTDLAEFRSKFDTMIGLMLRGERALRHKCAHSFNQRGIINHA